MGGKSLVAESGTKVGSSTGLLYGSVKIKMEGSSGVSEKDTSVKVVMDAVPLDMGVDTVSVEAAVVRSYSLRHWMWCRSFFVI